MKLIQMDMTVIVLNHMPQNGLLLNDQDTPGQAAKLSRTLQQDRFTFCFHVTEKVAPELEITILPSKVEENKIRKRIEHSDIE